MNSQQAREILLRHRPGTSGEHDPEMRAALALDAQDPELAGWLKSHLQFQRSLQAGIREVPIPPGLKEQILAERRAFFTLSRVPRRTVLAGVLAGVLGLIVAGFFVLHQRPDPEAQFATFRSRMVRTALRGYAMDLESRNPTDIRQFLSSRNAPGDWQSTTSLDQQPLLGCAVLPWQNHSAAMVCYGSAKVPELWLFVVNTATLPDAPKTALESARVNRLNTVSWSRGGKTYILAGSQDDAELRRLLASGG